MEAFWVISLYRVENNVYVLHFTAPSLVNEDCVDSHSNWRTGAVQLTVAKGGGDRERLSIKQMLL